LEEESLRLEKTAKINKPNC